MTVEVGLQADDEDAVEAGKVSRNFGAGGGEGRAGEGEDGGALGVADLGEQGAAGAEAGGGLPDEALDEAEAVGAAVQTEAGLVLADLGRTGLELGAGDVGEVGGDDVGPTVQWGEQVALQEADAFGDAVALGVAAGEGEGVRGDVDGGDLGLREVDGQSDGDGAGASADVGDGDGAAPTGEIEDEVDEGLGVGAGDDGGGDNFKFEAVELAAAQDVGGGLAHEAPGEEGVEGAGGLLGQILGEALVEVGAVRVEGVGEEELGLEGGFIRADGGEGVGGVAEGLADGGMALTPGGVICDSPRFFAQRYHALLEGTSESLRMTDHGAWFEALRAPGAGDLKATPTRLRHPEGRGTARPPGGRR